MITLTVNGQKHEIDADSDMPLLWALRDKLDLTGTKFGCGLAQCGACTVHVGGQPVRSCSIAAADVKGETVTTVEGLSGRVAESVQDG
jgi:isoquinoline 1-oxidoreductase alpha subunit